MTKTKDKVREMKSNCCKADVITVNGFEGTYHWYCDKCKKPCDTYVKNMHTIRKQLTSKLNKGEKKGNRPIMASPYGPRPTKNMKQNITAKIIKKHKFGEKTDYLGHRLCENCGGCEDKLKGKSCK